MEKFCNHNIENINPRNIALYGCKHPFVYTSFIFYKYFKIHFCCCLVNLAQSSSALSCYDCETPDCDVPFNRDNATTIECLTDEKVCLVSIVQAHFQYSSLPLVS